MIKVFTVVDLASNSKNFINKYESSYYYHHHSPGVHFAISIGFAVAMTKVPSINANLPIVSSTVAAHIARHDP